MSISQTIAAAQLDAKGRRAKWTEPILSASIGLIGGMLQSVVLSVPLGRGLVTGALFGLLFALVFARRADTAGAGLIWAMAAALLLWLTWPAGLQPLLAGGGHSMAMLADASEHFPALVAYLVCLGMPVGVIVGARRSLRARATGSHFHWRRAVVAGGFAGLLAG